MPSKTEAYRDAAGRLVGKRSGKTFVRGARDKHFLKRPPAVSLDARVCERVFADCEDMRVVNLDTGAVYGISVQDFQLHMRRLDRGFGDQYMVSLSHWRLIAPPIGAEPAPPPAPSAEDEAAALQPRLI
ncbi:MAG: hypothetical protein IT336_11460 [Thermomicrobiales bacterium]|nr:hypothetical protein [Thermomicrobiales bacterium]